MIKNILKKDSNIVVTLDDGEVFWSDKGTDELYSDILALQSNENPKDKLMALFYPEQQKRHDTYELIKRSSILEIKDGSAYIPSISNLTVPQMLAEKIAIAEDEGNEDAITAYKNFWTLLSLNPNSEVRDNMFWFLNKWGMSVCKSGLIVAYRNVDLKSEGLQYDRRLTSYVSKSYYNIKRRLEDPADYNVVMTDGEYYITENDSFNENEYIIVGNLAKLYENIVFAKDDAGTVYTDNRTHKFEIRLGHVVSMPRRNCDETQVSCSAGLHCGAKGWLKDNYCGTIGIKVLVSPADICSVPKEDCYGKMRTCAYYPIQIIDFDCNGDVIDEAVPDGFEVDFINKICYDGEVNNIDNDNYKIEIPAKLNIKDREEAFTRLKNVAMSISRRI